MQGIDDLEKTTRVRSSDLRQPSDRPADTSDLIVTIFDGSSDPVQYHLRSFGKAYVTFGRSESNDIVFGSKIVSREHGRFSLSGGHWVIEDCGAYSNSPSANGLIYNNSSVTKRVLCEGDLIRIDDGVESIAESVLIVAVFWGTVGLPPEGLLTEPFAELLCTTFLTAVASTAMGLFVSSLFTNADKAMTVAPILLMPQILFSGLIFKLDGATEAISWFAVCRWSMEGYGTTADLNSLELRLQQEGVMIPHEAEDFFEHTVGHLEHSWLILILFVAAFLVLARIVLSNIDKDKS